MNEDYRKLQIEGSDWSYGSSWGDQMENSINGIFGDIPKDKNVLDVGCGEGRGLMALYNLGFNKRNIIGVDIAPEKIKAAIDRGFIVLNEDFHYLKPIPDKYFDYVYSAHTLEHAYDLELAINSLLRVCADKLFFIVPIGETKEEVEKYNPSHTSPIKDCEQLDIILQKTKLRYTIVEKSRKCKEAWVIVFKNESRDEHETNVPSV